MVQITDSFDPAARYKLGSDVILQQFGQEALLLHVTTENVYQLNATGAEIVALLTQGISIAEAMQQLLSEFDVSEVQLERELKGLLADLLDQGLIARVTDS
ncbi:MAG: PqqD family peptide modification chaperone [Anaerolineae bacterium]|nr:PqqD family peptide modification chaperone [Anaerolineae bacterium]